MSGHEMHDGIITIPAAGAEAHMQKMKKLRDTLADDESRKGTVTVEPMENLFHYWRDPRIPLNWDCLFVLPPWLRAWWVSFGRDRHQCILTVRCDGELMGIAPLMVEGTTARLIGDSELCDYGDFITVPGKEDRFMSLLLAQLRSEGITRLEMGHMREGSPVLSLLTAHGRLGGWRVSCEQTEEVYAIKLPNSWEEFLCILSGKERHELRRKERRLMRAGHVSFRAVEERKAIESSLDIFVDLFRLNRPDKARFMHGERERFFRLVAGEMAREGLTRLFLLEIEKQPVASVLCFDYRSTVYLYNNGYDSRFSSLSVGLLSMVFSLRESITRNRRVYDLLKGSEPYKRRMGGIPSQLVRCKAILI